MVKEELTSAEYTQQLVRFTNFKNRRWSDKARRNNHYYFGLLTDFLEDKAFNRDYVEKFFDSLSKRGLARSTRRQAETAILAFVRWLFDEDVLTKNWSNRIERTLVIKHPQALPSQTEVIKLIKEVTKPGKFDNVLHRFSKNEHKWCLLFIVTASGTRNFETREIRLQDVSVGTREIVIEKGKTGPRTIAIPPVPWLVKELSRRVRGRTKEELRCIADRHHYKEDYRDRLFVVNASRLEDIMREVGKRWNGQPLKVHDLRRICLRDLKRNGAGVDDIKNVAGHSDIKTTLQYLMYDSNDQQKTLKNFSSEARKYHTKEEKVHEALQDMSKYGVITKQKFEDGFLTVRLKVS